MNEDDAARLGQSTWVYTLNGDEIGRVEYNEFEVSAVHKGVRRVWKRNPGARLMPIEFWMYALEWAAKGTEQGSVIDDLQRWGQRGLRIVGSLPSTDEPS